MSYTPFLKWVGGKSQILSQLFERFPSKINNYFEPFVGGGSVFFELLNRIDQSKVTVKGTIYISDSNRDLIYLYLCIKHHVGPLISKLTGIVNNYSQAPVIKYPKRHKFNVGGMYITDAVSKGKAYVYYYYRYIYNTSHQDELLTRACLFLFLNKTCFRGLYRVGSKGFNVPFGNYARPTIFNAKQLRELSTAFNKYSIKFRIKDFVQACRPASKGDFIYFDPPYYPLKKESFTSYSLDSFEGRHKNLVELCQRLRQKSVKFLHSNSWCKYNLDNYQVFYTEKLLCKRRINSKNPKDQDYEILIWN